jgi:hypothetical protein
MSLYSAPTQSCQFNSLRRSFQSYGDFSEFSEVNEGVLLVVKGEFLNRQFASFTSNKSREICFTDNGFQ